MKELTSEQYEQLPEFVQEDYVQDGGGYKHAGVMKMKGTLNDLNSKLESQKNENGELSGKLSEFEKVKAAEIEQARIDALAKAKKDNNVDDILRIEREKLEDERKRLELSSNDFNSRMQGIADNQKKATSQSITNELATDKGKKAFNKLIGEYISVDPATGVETFLNDDGSASSLNREQFVVEIAKNELFSSLVKADIATLGGGKLNGNNGISDPSNKQHNQLAEEAKKKGDGIGHLNAHFKKAFT